MSQKTTRVKAEYRSAIRSRKLIRQAYVELIKEKDIDKITVIDVVTRADVNRGTFYAHYKSVMDVSRQIENEILSALLEFLDEFKNTRLVENPLPFFTNIARFLEKDLEFYRTLINAQNSMAFLNQLKTIIIEKILSDEKKMSGIKNKEQFIICVNLFTSGCVGLYHDWFNHKIKMSLDDLTLNFSGIIKNGFKPFLPAKK
jgi:AcrR family transcriptional regulator